MFRAGMAETIIAPNSNMKFKSSFFLPMLFMPPDKRQALRSLYNFCRAADDAVDEVSSAHEARLGLDFWKQELHRIYHGLPSHPIARELQRTVQSFHIPEAILQEILKGFETDCAEIVALKDEAELEQYCYRVAGCVGIASLPIFGVSTQTYTPFAIALGHALQLTNILRDLDEDLGRGRCYFPSDVLARYAIPAVYTDEIHNVAWNRAAQNLAEQAEAYFKQTHHLVHMSDVKELMPALLMRDAYHLLLVQMRKSGVYLRKKTKVKRTTFNVMELFLNAFKYKIAG
jgi:phytoene synthase